MGRGNLTRGDNVIAETLAGCGRPWEGEEGGVDPYATPGVASIERNTLRDNGSIGCGGGLYAGWALVRHNTSFRNRSIHRGGGAFFGVGQFTFDTVLANNGDLGTGGVHISFTATEIGWNTIVGNETGPGGSSGSGMEAGVGGNFLHHNPVVRNSRSGVGGGGGPCGISRVSVEADQIRLEWNHSGNNPGGDSHLV